MIVTAAKEVTFDAAHRLSFHKGKCYNLHGHTYKLKLTLVDDSFDSEDNMVRDFYEIKQALSKIVEEYDHTTMLYGGELKNEKLIDTLLSLGMRVIVFPFEPTVENMAKHFAKTFKDMGLPVLKVTMYETPTSYAEVIVNEEVSDN